MYGVHGYLPATAAAVLWRDALDLAAPKPLPHAAKSSNDDLGRAVFVAAEGRGMGDLMAQYFDRLNPGGRELYEEYSEIPPPESLERQAKGVETVIPDPDRLMPPATVGAY